METDSVQWIDAVLADGEHAARLRSNLPYFAEHALKLRPKSGPLEPFILNPAQRKLHSGSGLHRRSRTRTNGRSGYGEAGGQKANIEWLTLASKVANRHGSH